MNYLGVKISGVENISYTLGPMFNCCCNPFAHHIRLVFGFRFFFVHLIYVRVNKQVLNWLSDGVLIPNCHSPSGFNQFSSPAVLNKTFEFFFFFFINLKFILNVSCESHKSIESVRIWCRQTVSSISLTSDHSQFKCHLFRRQFTFMIEAMALIMYSDVFDEFSVAFQHLKKMNGAGRHTMILAPFQRII